MMDVTERETAQLETSGKYLQGQSKSEGPGSGRRPGPENLLEGRTSQQPPSIRPSGRGATLTQRLMSEARRKQLELTDLFGQNSKLIIWRTTGSYWWSLVVAAA